MPEETQSVSGDPGMDKLLTEISSSMDTSDEGKEKVAPIKVQPSPLEEPAKVDFVKSLSEIDKILGSSVSKPGEKVSSVPETKKIPSSPEVTTEEIEDKKAGRPERDLSGFNEQQAKFLRRMPYEGYQYFSKVIKEAESSKEAIAARERELTETKAKLSGEAPKSYYENPDAFTILPKAKAIVAEVTKFDAVIKHWEGQLSKIDSGEDWEDLSQDPRSGEIYVSRKLPATQEARNEVTRKLAQAMSIVDNGTKQYHQLAEEHKKASENYATKVSSLENNYLPLFSDKEKAPAKLAEGIRSKLKEAGVEDNPYIGMLSKSIALNLILKHQISLYLKEASTAKLPAEGRAAGPSGKELSGNRESTTGNQTAKIMGYNEINKVLSSV